VRRGRRWWHGAPARAGPPTGRGCRARRPHQPPARTEGVHSESHLFQHRCGHRSRGDRVDGDPVTLHLAGQCLGEGVEAGLGRRVGRLAGLRLVRRGGREEDDPTARSHGRQHRTTDEKRRPEVGGHDRVERRRGLLAHEGSVHAAGRVDQQVDRASRVRDLLGAGFLRAVAHDETGTHRRRRLHQWRLASCVEHHVVPLGGQAQSHGQTDAAAAPRYEGASGRRGHADTSPSRSATRWRWYSAVPSNTDELMARLT